MNLVREELEEPLAGGLEHPCQRDEDCRSDAYLVCDMDLKVCNCPEGSIFDTDIHQCGMHSSCLLWREILARHSPLKEKGAGLVGLNLSSGAVEHQVLLKMKEPDYDVDELEGRIFNVKDKKEITAYSVK